MARPRPAAPGAVGPEEGAVVVAVAGADALVLPESEPDFGRSATNHSAANSTVTARRIWTGRETWSVITPGYRRAPAPAEAHGGGVQTSRLRRCATGSPPPDCSPPQSSFPPPPRPRRRGPAPTGMRAP